MNKLCFVDCETTGTIAGKHAIHELSYILADLSGGPFLSCCPVQRTIQVMPFPQAQFHPTAMQLASISEDEMLMQHNRYSYYNAKRAMVSDLGAYVSRYDKADKFTFVAYNAPFDDDHLRAMWDKCQDKYYGAFFWWPAIDVAQLAMYKMGNARFRLPNFKLGTICNYFGVEFDSQLAHDADYDILKTMQLFWALSSEDHNLGSCPIPEKLPELGSKF